MFKSLLNHLFPPLPCAGKLVNCPKDLTRFRFTCLYCWWRRLFYAKISLPPFWIQYAYESSRKTFCSKTLMLNGVKYRTLEGEVFIQTVFTHVNIDPRGHFIGLRYAAIITFDKIMKFTGYRKPFAEFSEFLACYPTW